MKIIYRVSGNDTFVRELDDGVQRYFKKRQILHVFRQIFRGHHVLVLKDNTTWEPAADEVREVQKSGNSSSFKEALDIAVKEYRDDELVYFVEDDYLHTEDAPTCIQEGIRLKPLVSLYDHLDKYHPEPCWTTKHVWAPRTSQIYYSTSCHWRTAVSTCMTFAAMVSTLKKHYSTIVQHLSTPIPRDHVMFQAMMEELITPIPGKATHLGHYMSPVVDWNEMIERCL